MLAGRRYVVLIALSVATALTLTAVAAGAGVSRASNSSAAAASALENVRRNVVWYGVPETSPRSIHIESTSINATTPDEFQIVYSAGNFTLVYQRTAGGPVTDRYTLSMAGLTEWNDTSGDGHFEADQVVASTPLGTGAFGRYPITHAMTTTADGVHMNTFLISSNRGDVVLNLSIADGFVRLPSGQWLTPMEAKLSLNITHDMTLSTTRLSLQIGFTTDQKVALDNQSWDDQQEFSSDERAVNVTNDASAAVSSAYFAWSNTATVNGVPGSVIATGPLPNDTVPGSYDLYLSYPRAAPGQLHLQIQHDPTIGVVSVAYLNGLPPGSPLPFQGDAVLYAASLVAIGALVAATAFLVNRRRKSP